MLYFICKSTIKSKGEYIIQVKQLKLIFDDGVCYLYGQKAITPGEPSEVIKSVLDPAGYTIIKEEDCLNAFMNDGWKLHTASYNVLGEQEIHYFILVK